MTSPPDRVVLAAFVVFTIFAGANANRTYLDEFASGWESRSSSRSSQGLQRRTRSPDQVQRLRVSGPDVVTRLARRRTGSVREELERRYIGLEERVDYTGNLFGG